MVAEVFGGISALKAALDIAKTIKDANDVTTRQGIVIKLQEQILSAQAAQLTLIEDIGTLKEKVTKLENWNAEKQQYELKSLGWNTFAYMLKPDARSAKPPHWVCTRCYADGYAEVIQQTRLETVHRGRGMKYCCPRCDWAIDPSSDAFEEGSGRPKWLD
jgi:hypothetical protein